MEEPKLLKMIEELGHVAFRNGRYNINIIGVRSKSRVANKYDDILHCIYKDDLDQWVDIDFQITTDAGTYWLENPSRVAGTAILCAGQYRGVYKIDKHGGKYEALCQRNGKVKVYRDNNRNEVLDHDPETIEDGYFGINIHRSNSRRESILVEKWSAGCQVFCDPTEFQIFMRLCKKSAELYGNSFTYTLIEE